MLSRLLPLIIACAAPYASAAEHRIASAADLARLPPLAAGDTVVMRDGPWRDQRIVLKAAGTADRPITLRAETPGGVVLDGDSSVEIDGAHLVVEGVWLKDSTSERTGIEVRGSDCRITSCAVSGGMHRNYLRLSGIRHRVDHCHFSGKTTDAPTVQIEVEEQPNHHRLDHNHFGHRPPLGRNGGETVRVGYSHQSMRSSATVFEHNLFERCDGEIEIISNKSCDNIYRANTFFDCAGFLTLRHGDRCRVEGNFFFGNLKRGSGGVRIIGEGHFIANNYIDSVAHEAFRITAGIPDSPLTGYAPTKDCTIAFNTVVASSGPCIDLDAGMGTAGRTLRPERISIVHNVFSLPRDAILTKGIEGEDFVWTGNFSNRDNGDRTTTTDLMLNRGTEGVWRPDPGSPLQRAAAPYPGITHDFDGQPRIDRFDAGCDQISPSPATSRPLLVSDVGPAWLRPPSTEGLLREVLAHDRERILVGAAAALERETLTITRFRAALSEGGPNDFYSNGDYWWPDPEKPGGLPYVKRDGETNPANFIAHRDAMRDLRDAVAALAAAWQLTADERYPAKAANLLRVFLLDPATRMNPHLDYAQAIPGITPGRGIGIIDTLHLIEIPKAVRAMEGATAFDPELCDGLRRWFRDYSRWMTESKNGKEEAATKNNHAVAYFLQLAAFAEFTADQAAMAECRRRFKEVFVPGQMAEDGGFPRELARTKPYAYSIFQLDNMTALCQLLSTPEDNLWDFELSDGRGIRRAMAYLHPFLEDKSKWPHPPDVQAWEGWPARQPCLLFASLAYGKTAYFDLWKKLDPDPRDQEVRRNIAITQPSLWLGE